MIAQIDVGTGSENVADVNLDDMGTIGDSADAFSVGHATLAEMAIV